MDIDIKAYVEKILSALNADGKLLENFKKDPKSIVISLLENVQLDDGVIESIINAVKAKLGLDETAKSASGILAFIKKLFAKKA